MATDQGRHLAALRDRARRPDIKDRSGRGLERQAAIALSQLDDEDEPESGQWDSPGTSPEDDDADEG